ncbi:AbrB/MazE/SpoVT family DNA-binding domain-containing protein [Virgibacillus sp. MSJ-26]|uniref:AbrB/MazE/SpoVT family DNA-binding domain-containing protein n=1 Tax=Virgibacillus sp. MSJ-26 TaxID=2841522 RepID=UPI001C0F6986|nr:AbrB/MazE/SpoVT family DNA-binding domain-containing protein [Virgibacillus sp. MSJ-26]MBU5465387.1 AbrB/MazE/SpoVT family DNA-binding domain-containing protein [Virgibacillus sp. MSJ-26]
MKEYERKITKIGNSYGITLPQELLREAGIDYGDRVEIEKVDDKIYIQKKKNMIIPKGLSPDFFEVLEKNTKKHEETLRDLIDR